mgnify:CR=1 FL=1
MSRRTLTALCFVCAIFMIFGMLASVSAFATVPTTMLRTIAANALKGYYSTETGAQHQGAISLLLAANTRNDVFTGEEVRDSTPRRSASLV